MVLQVFKHLVTMADLGHSDTTYGCLHTKHTKQMNTYNSQFSQPLPTVKSAVRGHQHSFLYHILKVQVNKILLKYQQYAYLLTHS